MRVGREGAIEPLSDVELDKKHAKIKSFWEARAAKFGDAWQATLGDRRLRMLEISTMIKMIRKDRPKSVLDVGCGNGYSTKIFAETFPDIRFTGMDFSESMIDLAKKSKIENASFFVGDVLKPETFAGGSYDLVITQRCLQNLADYDTQKKAIENLKRVRAADGAPLALMECSRDGARQLNRYLAAIGKKTYDNLEPWHNNFFLDRNLARDYNAKIIHFTSTYMFLALVVSRKLGEISWRLPHIGSFGYEKIYLIR